MEYNNPVNKKHSTEQSTRADYTPATRKGKHLNFTERQQIERWLREGISVRKIALRLNRNHSTIVRERVRGLVIHVDTELKEHEAYSCERAQGDADINKTAHGADLKLGNNTELARQMAELLTGGGEAGLKCSPYAAKKVSERRGGTRETARRLDVPCVEPLEGNDLHFTSHDAINLG